MNISAEPAARQSPFAAFFELLPKSALILDPAGIILAANEALRRHLSGIDGTAPKVGLCLADLCGTDATHLRTDLVTVAAGGRLTLRFRSGRPSSEATMGFRVTTDRDPEGRAHRYMLTEDRAREAGRAFADLNLKMRRANEEAARQRRLYADLRDAYHEVERFSYAAAHDLKAPLRNISALLGFLEEDHGPALPDDAREMVAEAQGAAGRLQRLIGDLLSHARLGTAAMDLAPVAISAVLDELERDLAILLTETGGRIDRGDLGWVQADRGLLVALLQNLVGNALKYRDPSRTPVIAIDTEASLDGTINLSVADNGLGFDPDGANRMFDAFERLANSSGAEGSGLGLATCRAICRRHGWTLTAEGQPGVGATFRIEGLHPAAPG